MATLSAHLPNSAGETGLNLLLYSLVDGSLLNAGGDALSEVANGLFQATVDDADIPATADARADVQNVNGDVIASDILYNGSTIIGIQPQAGLIDDIAESVGTGGARAVTITVSDGSANIPYAPVQLLDASDNPIGSVRATSSAGTLVLNLDDGSYKLLVPTMNGYDNHTAQTLTVSGVSTSITLTLTANVAVSAATDPALCNVLIKVVSQYGSPLAGAGVSARIDSPDFLLNTVVSNDVSTSATTDVNGEATLSLIRAVSFIRGGRYEIMVKNGNSTQKFEYYVPNQASVVATFTS